MEQENEFCKKIVFRNSGSKNKDIMDTIILGIIKKEDEHLITIKTARKEYIIGKRYIISIEETNQKYEGVK